MGWRRHHQQSGQAWCCCPAAWGTVAIAAAAAAAATVMALQSPMPAAMAAASEQCCAARTWRSCQSLATAETQQLVPREWPAGSASPTHSLLVRTAVSVAPRQLAGQSIAPLWTGDASVCSWLSQTPADFNINTNCHSSAHVNLFAGDTALTAVKDALRIARLHTFLQRLRRLTGSACEPPSSAAVPPSAAVTAPAVASSGSSFLLPGCGSVQLLHLSPLRAVLAARPLEADAATAESESAAAASPAGKGAPTPAPDLRVTIEWLPPGTSETAQPDSQQPTSCATAAAGVSACPTARSLRCSVSAAVAAPDGAEEATAAAAAPVPEAWCAALAAMADAGEEALLLRGLAVAGPQLAAAVAAAAPEALAAAGWQPGQVTAQAARPPYGMQLLLHKVRLGRRLCAQWMFYCIWCFQRLLIAGP